jgi:hypothetical protein
MTADTLEAPILEAKLYPATGTSRPLPRPGLDSSSEVLDGRCPVVVLAAPAGYGKSMLMARWHGSLSDRGVACAWLSLDEDDNDEVRFVRHLVAALQRADARIGSAALGQLASATKAGAAASSRQPGSNGGPMRRCSTRACCLNGLEQVDSKLHGHPAHASLLHTLLAGIAYEFDEIDAANEHIERAMTNVDEYGPADAVIVAYLTRSRLQLLRRDSSGALAILQEGQELGERRGLRRVSVTLAAEECTCLGRAGQLEEARVLAVRFGFDELPAEGRASSLGTDKAFRAASRFLLRQSPRLVAHALGDAIDHSRKMGLFHRLVELLLLRALAHEHDGAHAPVGTPSQRDARPRPLVLVVLDLRGSNLFSVAALMGGPPTHSAQPGELSTICDEETPVDDTKYARPSCPATGVEVHVVHGLGKPQVA